MLILRKRKVLFRAGCIEAAAAGAQYQFSLTATIAGNTGTGPVLPAIAADFLFS